MHFTFFLTITGIYLTLKDDIQTKEGGYKYIGYVLVTGSALTRALANILSELLMSSNNSSHQKMNPMSLVFYSNPVELLILIPMFISVEAPQWTKRYLSTINPLIIIMIFVGDCIIVFILRYVTNLTIQNTSSLTITVFAKVKFVISILISMMFFNYIMTIHRFIGLVFMVVGMFLYGYIKNVKKKDDNNIV